MSTLCVNQDSSIILYAYILKYMIIINGQSLFIGNKTKTDSWKINDSIINKAMRLMTTFLRTRFPLENLFQINSIQMAIILTTRDQSRKRVKNPQKYKSSRDHLKMGKGFYLFFLHNSHEYHGYIFFYVCELRFNSPVPKTFQLFYYPQKCTLPRTVYIFTSGQPFYLMQWSFQAIFHGTFLCTYILFPEL